MASRILVAGASRHGATLDIVDAIASVLTHRGFSVIDKPLEEVSDPGGFDAVVIGSAVYVGRWMGDAVDFIDNHADELCRIPVWLFSSGPIGDPPMPEGDPTEVPELIDKIQARGHRIFAGRLDKDRLGLGERLIVSMVRAPSGDFRDFPQVAAWANEIADSLDAEAGADSEEEVDRTREALLVAAMR